MSSFEVPSDPALASMHDAWQASDAPSIKLACAAATTRSPSSMYRWVSASTSARIPIRRSGYSSYVVSRTNAVSHIKPRAQSLAHGSRDAMTALTLEKNR